MIAEGQHRLLVILSTGVDPAADLRGPQLDAIVLEQRLHLRALTAGIKVTPADGITLRE